MSEWVHVAELRELARRKKKQVTVAGEPVALFLVADEVFAIADTCGHKQRSLAKGTLLDGQVVCPGHQWKFDPATGQAEDQDLCQAVYSVQVTEEGHVLVGSVPLTRTRGSAMSSDPAPAAGVAS